MKKSLKHIISIIGCMLMLISCNDYLEVQPEDEFLEEDVFSKEVSIQNVLNGIYTNLTTQSTYGGNLTMSTVEVFGQQFNLSYDSHSWAEYGDYNYEDSGVLTNIDAIYTDMYFNIFNINNFIAGLETYSGVLSEEKENILKGEAIGLRAMLHFDLLRLFGPIYSEFPEDDAIPYNLEATSSFSSILPANEVMELILDDLSTAETLLANDPIKEYGKLAVLLEDSYDLVEGDEGYGYEDTDFYRYRNLRLNYYAIKALQARVNLYAGNNPDALSAAKSVIDEASQWFPWTVSADVFTSLDRVFTKEILFGIQNTNINTRQNGYYNGNLSNTNILSAHPSRLIQVFEGIGSDFRNESTWVVPSDGSKGYKTFLKYANVTSSTQYMQPLIKMSEMYYIAAETEPDPTLALGYLNTVRNNRLLSNLSLGVDLESEIYKEYRKEFYGEGQLFFYYKRKNFTEILSGSTSSLRVTVPMSSATYVLPLPLSETDYR